jgi:hypothetical protein
VGGGVAGLVFGAGLLSLWLGGAVPATVAEGPAGGSPGAAVDYALNGLGDYLVLFGPWPVVAGILEGGLFGYWMTRLESP